MYNPKYPTTFSAQYSRHIGRKNAMSHYREVLNETTHSKEKPDQVQPILNPVKCYPADVAIYRTSFMFTPPRPKYPACRPAPLWIVWRSFIDSLGYHTTFCKNIW